MGNMGTPNYGVLKIMELIENYFNNYNSYAEVELKNRVIEGGEIIDALSNIKSEFDEETDVLQDKIQRYTNRIKEYHKIIRELREDRYEGEVAKNIESLIKGKEGPFVEKIKDILKESKKAKKV